MGKHLDQLKSLDEFRAPWETEGGSDAEIDKSKLKRWIHGILSDKAKAQDARDEADEAVKKAEKDLETAKSEAASVNGPDAQKKIDALQKKLDETVAERDQLISDKEVAELRTEALKDIDPKYHEWINGTTQDELDKSIEKFKETFGIEDQEADPDDDDDPVVRTQPRRLVNGGDDKSGKPGEGDIDFDKAADDILSARGNVFSS